MFREDSRMLFSGAQRNDVFAHEVCDGSVRDKDVRCVFYLGACTQGKLNALHRKGLPSPIHTEVRVLFGFFSYNSFNSPYSWSTKFFVPFDVLDVFGILGFLASS